MDEVKLEEARDKLETELRRAGLYTDHIEMIETPHGETLLIVNATVGDIAFSDRVHDPDKHETDSQFRGVIKDAQRAEMQEMREDLKRKALEGGSFWDDDNDEEWDISELEGLEPPEEPA